ncbi:M48 family metallopeptidase [bacterium]|nr:M48 family metallopeptidase [bacterium]
MSRTFRWLFLLALLTVLMTGPTTLAQEIEPVSMSVSEALDTLPDSALALDSSVTMANGLVEVPEPTDKAMRYYRSGNLLWVVGNLWGWAVPILILFSGLSGWFERIGKRIGKKWYFGFVIYILLFTLADFILSFPLSYYSEFVRQHAYDLSNQSFGAWFGDSIKGMLVGIVMALLFLWIPLRLIKKVPTRWWLYFSLGAIPFLILGLMVAPIWIQPLFDDFGPMQDKELEAKILNVADRAGIEGGRVFEVNKSEDTNSINAYVTGFGGTKRIVLWDTIIEQMDDEEILFVMGHEMGHYVLGHMYTMILMGALLILIGMYAVHRTAGWVLKKWGDRFGFHHLSDIAAIPLILLLFSLASFLLSPVVNGVSRYQETACDKFGLELTRDNHSAATAFIKLQQTNLANPRPGWLYKLWRASHPPIGERVDLMNRYKPWENGEPLRFEKYLEPPQQKE